MHMSAQAWTQLLVWSRSVPKCNKISSQAVQVHATIKWRPGEWRYSPCANSCSHPAIALIQLWKECLESLCQLVYHVFLLSFGGWVVWQRLHACSMTRDNQPPHNSPPPASQMVQLGQPIWSITLRNYIKKMNLFAIVLQFLINIASIVLNFFLTPTAHKKYTCNLHYYCNSVQ